MDMSFNRAQLENGGTGIQTQVAWLWSSPYNHLILLLLMSKGMDKEMRMISQ